MEERRTILLHAARLGEEINLRLLLQQELYGDILFVEEIVVTGIGMRTEKKRRLSGRVPEWIKSRRRKGRAIWQ